MTTTSALPMGAPPRGTTPAPSASQLASTSSRKSMAPLLIPYSVILQEVASTINVDPGNPTKVFDSSYQFILKEGAESLAQAPYLVNEIGCTLLMQCVSDKEEKACQAMLDAHYKPSKQGSLEKLSRRVAGLLTLYWHDQKGGNLNPLTDGITRNIRPLQEERAVEYLTSCSGGKITDEQAKALAKACGCFPLAIEAILVRATMGEVRSFDSFTKTITHLAEKSPLPQFEQIASVVDKTNFGLSATWQVLYAHLLETQTLIAKFTLCLAQLEGLPIHKACLGYWIADNFGTESYLTEEYLIHILVGYRLVVYDEETQIITLDKRRADIIKKATPDPSNAKRGLVSWIACQKSVGAEKVVPTSICKSLFAHVVPLLPLSSDPYDLKLTSTILASLAQHLIEVGENAAALEKAQEARKYVNQASSEENNRESVIAQSVYARALIANNRAYEGFKRHKEAAHRARLLSEKAPSIALFDVLIYYGFSLCNAGHFVEAKSIYQEAIGVISKLDGVAEKERVELKESCKMSLATIDARRGQTEEAHAVIEEIFTQASSRNEGTDNFHTANIRFNLANLQLLCRQYQEGLKNLELAIKAHEEICAGSITVQLCSELETAYKYFAAPYGDIEKAQMYKEKWEAAKAKLPAPPQK